MKNLNLKFVRLFLWIILIASYALICKDYYAFLADNPEATPMNILCSALFFLAALLLALLSKFKPIKLILLQVFFVLLIISYYITTFDLPNNLFTVFNMIFLYYSILPLFPLPSIGINISAWGLFLGIDAIFSLCMISGHLYRKKHN